MKNRKYSLLEDSIQQYDMLFPNVEFRQKIDEVTNAQSKGMLKLILLQALFFVAIFLISVFLPETIRYLFFNIGTFTTMIFIGLGILRSNKPIKQLYKIQIEELKIDKDKYHYELILHKNYRRYLKKWNIVYFIIIIIVLYATISLLTIDIIKTGNTTYGPAIGGLILLIVLAIPTLILNITFFKIFRRKQRIVEAKIKRNKSE